MSIATLPMAEAPTIDYAATAFLIVCASLVLFMTVPGLALFYGVYDLARARGELLGHRVEVPGGRAGGVGDHHHETAVPPKKPVRVNIFS